MAAAGTFVGTFPSSITSSNVLSWSEDNRLSVATDGGLFILSLLVNPTHTDAACHFHHAKIPPSKDSALCFVDFDYKTFTKDLPNEEIHQLMLDRTLDPRTGSTTSNKGYKTAAWSPWGGDEIGRCLVASISHDHQVCIHTSGDTKKTWTMIADLSKMYAAENTFKGNLTFSILRQQTYKLAAVELCWSDHYTAADKSGVKFSLLAVAMKNGDIVLWRVKQPCTQESDCSVVKVLSLSSDIPTSMSWCAHIKGKNRAVLAVGYNTGLIYTLDIRLGAEVKVTPVCIHDNKDNLRVSCMCWKNLKLGGSLLLSGKEQFLFAHKIKLEEKLTYQQKAVATGGHWMEGTGISSRDRITVLSSADGMVQNVMITELRNKKEEIVIEMCPIKYPRDDNYKWSCYGAALSPNGCFCAAVFTPSSSFCHLEMREPIKVQVIHVGDTEFIHEYGGPLSRAGDVFEAYRQGICCEVDLADLLKEHRLNVTDLTEQPIKALKIYRFLFLTLENLLRNSPEQSREDSIPITKDIEKFTDEIHWRLIKQRLETLPSKHNLTNLEKQILRHTRHWLFSSSPKRCKPEVVVKVMSKVKDNSPAVCTICEENLEINHCTWKCGNGHSFGACCLTLVPCDTIPYRTCQTCGCLSLQLAHIQGITWLANDLTKCALCEGQLL